LERREEAAENDVDVADEKDQVRATRELERYMF